MRMSQVGKCKSDFVEIRGTVGEGCPSGYSWSSWWGDPLLLRYGDVATRGAWAGEDEDEDDKSPFGTNPSAAWVCDGPHTAGCLELANFEHLPIGNGGGLHRIPPFSTATEWRMDLMGE
jgi:hypothetical protein